MSEPVSSIRNLGSASDSAYGRAGIKTAEQMRELGPDEAYRLYLSSGGQPHFIGYYALVMGLQGRPWNDCQGAEKEALRARFDALKAAASTSGNAPAGIDAALAAIGVIKR